MRVFPARAGMNRHQFKRVSPTTGVPRPRGDEPDESKAAMSRQECSPPARG